MGGLTVEVARWLVGDGLPVVAEATSRLDEGGDELTVATAVRTRGIDPERARAVLDAAMARRRAREHWQEPESLVATMAALEQASDPRVARHRAGRHAAHGGPVADLGCGIGGDALALAASGLDVLAIDLDPARLILCRHNAVRLGASVWVARADALSPPVGPGTAVHADPGRRPGGRRARRLRDHEPPVGALAEVVGRQVGGGIVLSPAVPLDDPDLPAGELEFVQVGPRLVEATCWLGAHRRPGVLATATVLDDHGRVVATRSRTAPPADVPVSAPGEWVLEPAPALVRARLHHDHAVELRAGRLASNRALLTCDTPPPGSAWHTAWHVEAVVPGRPRAVADAVRGLEPAPLSISLHGDDRPIDQWWKALRGQPRGPIGRRVLVVAADGTTMAILARPWPTPTPATTG